MFTYMKNTFVAPSQGSQTLTTVSVQVQNLIGVQSPKSHKLNHLHQMQVNLIGVIHPGA